MRFIHNNKKLIQFSALLVLALAVLGFAGLFSYNASKVSLAKNRTIKIKSVWKNTGKFSSVSADISEADVIIKSGDSFKVRIPSSNKCGVKYKISGDKLILTQKSTLKKNLIIKCKPVVIELPEKTNLSDISLKSASGDAEIKEINADSGTFNLDSGDLDLNTVTLEKGNFKADSGDIYMNGVSFKDAAADAESGDISVKLKDSLSGYTIRVSAASGDVRVGKKTYEEPRKRTVGKGKNKLTLSADSGDIKVVD